MTSTVLARVAAAFSLLAAASAAQADAVGIPMTCPAGTRGDGCHGAEYCTPLTCTRDSECGAGMRCTEVRYCVRTKRCTGGRGGMVTTVTDHYQSCGDAPCPEGGCEPSRVCAVGSPPRDAGRPRDSGPRADAGAGRTHARYGCGCE